MWFQYFTQKFLLSPLGELTSLPLPKANTYFVNFYFIAVSFTYSKMHRFKCTLDKIILKYILHVVVVVVQSLSRVWLFGTPWIVTRQASQSFTMSWSLLKLMSIESVMLSNQLILCRPLLLLPSHVTITQIKTDNIPIFLERYLIALSSQSSTLSLEISLLIHITIYLYCYMIFIMLNFI